MNNMDLGYEMFCYQCEQTANGKGCTKIGVCGKTPEIANLQDLLIFQIKGISCYGKVLQNEGQHIDKNIIRFIENVLFTTLTNVNFDSKVHVELLNESQRIKENLRTITGEIHNQTSYATYDLPETKTQMLLEQTKGTGVNVYTHGEMLPCHGYEGLKKYPHLVGNFGGAWQDQQKQFDDLPGCILMTTNCLMRPRESYKGRIYSTNVVGWDCLLYTSDAADE